MPFAARKNTFGPIKTLNIGKAVLLGLVTFAAIAVGGIAESGGTRTGEDIPKQDRDRGLRAIVWRVYEEIGRDRVLAVAGGVTFYGLLALFPAITAFVSVYSLFVDRATVVDHISTLHGILPQGAIEVITGQLRRILGTPTASLGFAFVAGLGVAMWSANAGMKSMMEALNVAYGETEKRSFISLNAQSLLFTSAALVFVLLLVFSIAIVPAVLAFFLLGNAVEILLWAGRWPVMFAIVMLSLSVLYRYGPSRANPQWRWITPGSVVAGVGLVAFSMVFSWYAASFGNYNETYGSLGAVIGFMTWMWLSSVIVLIGAEVNAETEIAPSNPD